MSRLNQNKKMIDTAILAQKIPRQRGSTTVLPTGQRRDALGAQVLAGQANLKNSSYIIIADQLGTLTESGKYYYERSGQPKPDRNRFDRNQPLIHKNGSDYVITNNKQRLVRSLKPDGSTQLTALGRKYFLKKTTEYIVSVPTLISGTRANGNPYTRTSTIPVDQLGIGLIMIDSGLSEVERVREVKKRVLSSILGKSFVDSGGLQTIYEVSGETFKLDRDGDWLISSLSTVVDGQGQITTEAKMRQPLGSLRNCASFLPFPDQVLPVAFENHNDRLCIPRQLAELLGQTIERICETFDDLIGNDEWRCVGITPECLRKWCVCRGHPFFFY
jgi:hypothetical protein